MPIAEVVVTQLALVVIVQVVFWGRSWKRRRHAIDAYCFLVSEQDLLALLVGDFEPTVSLSDLFCLEGGLSTALLLVKVSEFGLLQLLALPESCGWGTETGQASCSSCFICLPFEKSLLWDLTTRLLERCVVLVVEVRLSGPGNTDADIHDTDNGGTKHSQVLVVVVVAVSLLLLVTGGGTSCWELEQKTGLSSAASQMSPLLCSNSLSHSVTTRQECSKVLPLIQPPAQNKAADWTVNYSMTVIQPPRNQVIDLKNCTFLISGITNEFALKLKFIWIVQLSDIRMHS